jgi:sulfatase modifying factor 1
LGILRSRVVLGLAAPLTTLLLALAATMGGCSRGSQLSVTTARRPNGDDSVAARLPAAFSKRSLRANDQQRARTLTNGSPFIPLGRATPDTPLEQLLAEGDRPLTNNGLCPPDMATIDDLYCVDRYEASLVEVLATGDERPFSPYEAVDGHVVRAMSEPGVFPQGYISEIQAGDACARSGKRLCSPREWRKACMGPQHVTYGYASENQPRRCNDHGRSPVVALSSGEDLSAQDKWNWDRMNQPALNQLEGTLARSGSHPGCTNDYGVYDMVGNLHEWVADPNGTFQGGYYQDTQINGEGCTYTTKAHAAWYHDYSTGFRCCADPAP